MSFYQRIIERLPKGLSESEQARKLDIDRHRLRIWKLQDAAGKPITPRPQTIERIASRLNVSEIYLRDGLGPIDRAEADAWIRANTNGGQNV